jgi:carbamoyl-phosphate synthase large subunit
MPLDVLMTAGSRRVPLVRAFQRALSETGGGRVVVTDVNALSPAVHVADLAFEVPLATDPAYMPTLDAICRREGIGLVVPTIDDELEVFGQWAPAFEAQGIRVATSPRETAAICNDKLLTARHLRAAGVAAALTWTPGEPEETASFPLFVKPRNGRGGIGAFAARKAEELAFFTRYVDRPVIQEYLEGPEFTIDMLCDQGTPLAIVPRERVVIRAGVMDRGRTVRDKALIRLAEACAAALPFHGPVNIQCRYLRGVATVFEINPRFSGGIPLTIAAGADFPRMLVDRALGRPVAPRIGRFTAGLWMTSYESSIFVPDASASSFARPGRRQEVA